MKSSVLSLLCLVMIAATIGCKVPLSPYSMPSAELAMHPGPGVDGPGPGVIMDQPMMPVGGCASQVSFVGPQGMQVTWDVAMAGQFDSEPLVCPGRQNFQQGAIYRLKLTNIPGRAGVELYPTLEVAPEMPRTSAFLAHSYIPIQITNQDLDQVLSGNFVTKVIYLPDPENQGLAIAGAETLVSTRLDPGVDPIVEADRRGAILAVFRLGNKDLQIPGDDMMQQGMAPPSVLPASYQESISQGAPAPMAANLGVGSTIPTQYISGVTAPMYGMPITPTPICLPGPPHIPLGSQASLQKHVIRNHTQVKLGHPPRKISMDVKQIPGYIQQYPRTHSCYVEGNFCNGGVCGPGCYDGCVTGAGCSGGTCTTGAGCTDQ